MEINRRNLRAVALQLRCKIRRIESIPEDKLSATDRHVYVKAQERLDVIENLLSDVYAMEENTRWISTTFKHSRLFCIGNKTETD